MTFSSKLCACVLITLYFASDSGVTLQYYQCRSVSTAGKFFDFRCAPGQLVYVKSALVGYSDQYRPGAACPWTRNTSATCSELGLPQSTSNCNCTKPTDVPADRCNGRNTCRFPERILLFPQGRSAALCVLQRDANFVSVNYTCAQPTTTTALSTSTTTATTTTSRAATTTLRASTSASPLTTTRQMMTSTSLSQSSSAQNETTQTLAGRDNVTDRTTSAERHLTTTAAAVPVTLRTSSSSSSSSAVPANRETLGYSSDRNSLPNVSTVTLSNAAAAGSSKQTKEDALLDLEGKITAIATSLSVMIGLLIVLIAMAYRYRPGNTDLEELQTLETVSTSIPQSLAVRTFQ